MTLPTPQGFALLTPSFTLHSYSLGHDLELNQDKGKRSEKIQLQLLYKQ